MSFRIIRCALAHVLVTLSCLVSVAIGQEAVRPPVGAATNETFDQTHARIEAKLAKAADFEFNDLPLADVVDYVNDLMGVQLQLDRKHLDEEGIGADVPITVALKGVSARSALRLMLEPHNLVVAFDRGEAWVTTRADSETRFTARVYPVGDLVHVTNAEGGTFDDNDSLIELVTSSIAPDTWADSGGTGVIEYIGRSLVISTTAEIHDQTRKLLAALRKVKQPTDAANPVPVFTSDLEGFGATLLNKTVKATYSDTPLIDVLSDLSGQVGCAMVLDKKALEEEGIGGDTPITIDLASAPLRRVFSLALSERDLTNAFRDEVLFITTKTQAEAQLILGVYPVSDLVTPLGWKAGTPIDLESLDFNSLIETIKSTIHPDSWSDGGGASDLNTFTMPPMLVIPQTSNVHEKISDLLAQLRAARQQENANADPSQIQNRANQKSIASYRLAAGVDGQQVITMIRKQVESKSWQDPDTMLEAMGPRLVVKASDRVHRSLFRFLGKIDALDRDPKAGGGAGGGGGGGFFAVP